MIFKTKETNTFAYPDYCDSLQAPTHTVYELTYTCLAFGRIFATLGNVSDLLKV